MLAALALMLCVTSCGTKQEVKQEPETAAEAVKKMIAGWNVGNDMDCFDSDIKPGSPLEEYERSWGQSPANELMFKKLAEKGFDAIRVPVTWWQHMDAHDTGAAVEAWIKADSTSYATQHERYKTLWTQIANHFKDFDQRLLFEGYNEMLTGSNPTAEWSEPKDLKNLQYVNKFAQDFVDAVRATGGNNQYRNLIVNTYSGSHTPNTLPALVVPTDPCGNQNHLAVEVHSYDPWDWVNNYDMHWTEECTKEITWLFSELDKHIISKGYPVIIGEYGSNGQAEKTINRTCTDEQKQEAGRQAADIIRLCKQYGAAAFYWMGIIDGPDRSADSFQWSMEQVADSIIANK